MVVSGWWDRPILTKDIIITYQILKLDDLGRKVGIQQTDCSDEHGGNYSFCQFEGEG